MKNKNQQKKNKQTTQTVVNSTSICARIITIHRTHHSKSIVIAILLVWFSEQKFFKRSKANNMRKMVKFAIFSVILFVFYPHTIHLKSKQHMRDNDRLIFAEQAIFEVKIAIVH